MNKFAMELPKDGLHRFFFANGKMSYQSTFKEGKIHGLARVWHENGSLAEEKHYKRGLLHGVCKQWNKDGKLLGSFQILNGTGMDFEWHPNGQVRSEVSLVNGEMTGRARIWGDDGGLIVQKFFLGNRSISRRKYDELCRHNPKLPRFPDARVTNTLGRTLEREGKEKRKNVQYQLTLRQQIDDACAVQIKGPSVQEALKWMTGHRSARELGDLSAGKSRKLIRKLYSLGARKVWAVDIEVDPDGSQISNKLISRLPLDANQRGKIYGELAQHARPFLIGGSPAICVGQRFMSVSVI